MSLKRLEICNVRHNISRNITVHICIAVPIEEGEVSVHSTESSGIFRINNIKGSKQEQDIYVNIYTDNQIELWNSQS